MREVVSNFKVFIAIVIMIGVDSYIGINTQKLNVPAKFRVSALARKCVYSRDIAHMGGSRMDGRSVRQSGMDGVRRHHASIPWRHTVLYGSAGVTFMFILRQTNR